MNEERTFKINHPLDLLKNHIILPKVDIVEDLIPKILIVFLLSGLILILSSHPNCDKGCALKTCYPKIEDNIYKNVKLDCVCHHKNGHSTCGISHDSLITFIGESFVISAYILIIIGTIGLWIYRRIYPKSFKSKTDHSMV